MDTPARDQQNNSGYDFIYVECPQDKLVCKICKLPCREAQRSECCGNVFCKRDLEKRYACPECHVEPFKTNPDLAVDREIKKLRIYCQNKELGCGCNWVGGVDQIDAHLSKCEIACEYCKEVMHHTDMSSHINDCPCHCQHCGAVAEREVINDQHMKKCSMFPMPCPNTCGKDKILQGEMDAHRKQCPLEMVWCEYYDVGCKTMLVREKMEAHYKDEMAKHLQYMHKVVRQLQKGNDVDTEAKLLESTNKHKELQNDHNPQENTSNCKLRSSINKKYHKIEYNMIILVSVLVLVFAILIGCYDEKFVTFHTSQLRDDKLINLLQESMKLQNNRLEQVVNVIIEASANMETLKRYLISVLHHVISELKPGTISVHAWFDVLNELSKTDLLVSPVLKLPDYKGMIKRKENWTSVPFFAFDEGYQMCLKVYPAGIGDGAGDHVSVELYLMKGPHDGKLQQSDHWPLRGEFSIILYDQLYRQADPYDENPYDETRDRVYKMTLKSDIRNSRVTHGGMVKIDNLTVHQFVRRDDNYRSTFNSMLSNDGNLYFTVRWKEGSQNKVPYKDIYTLNQRLSNQKLSLQHALESLNINNFTKEVDDQAVAPVTLKLPDFSKLKTGDPWYSSPFYAFEGGYQMCMKVVKDRDCLMSVELFLMKGQNDEILQRLELWPFRGTFTIKLFANNKSYPSSILLDQEICTKCFERVTESDIASEGFGYSIFILDSICTQPDFFEGDQLLFEVSYNSYSN